MNQQALSALIWSVADLLRGDFKQSEYGRVILPFTVLRRLDCVLAPTRDMCVALRASESVRREPLPDAWYCSISAVDSQVDIFEDEPEA